MILLETERLILRNWCEEDQPVMHRLNSDEKTMEFFPFHRTREESNKMMADVSERIDDLGYGWSAVELKSSNEVVGFCGISDFTVNLPFTPAVEIGWRFLPESWGNGYATEAAQAWLEFGFSTLGLKRIISFSVPQNTASIAVMKRLGMKHYPRNDFDHPSISPKVTHLIRHVFYAIIRDEFAAKREKG